MIVFSGHYVCTYEAGDSKEPPDSEPNRPANAKASPLHVNMVSERGNTIASIYALGHCIPRICQSYLYTCYPFILINNKPNPINVANSCHGLDLNPSSSAIYH